MPEMLADKSLLKRLLVIFCVALLIRVAIVVATKQYLELNRFEMVNAALSLARTGTLGNPWGAQTGPSAHLMPGYPLVLAAVFRVFGAGVPGEIVKELLTCVLSSAQWVVIPLLAGRFGLPRQAMLLAGMAGALLPIKWRVDTLGDWEAVLAALALIGLSTLTVDVWRRRRFSGRMALSVGAFWGLGILISASFLAAAATVVCAGVLYFRGRDRAGWLRFAGIAGAAAGAVMSPWVIRNALQVGAPVLTRSNLGLELHVSFNDGATVRQQLDSTPGEAAWKRYSPMFDAGELAEVRKYGEIEYNRRKMAEATGWMATHPGRAAGLVAGRFLDYWLPRTRSRVRTLLWALLTLAGYGAAPLVWRASRPTAIVLASISAGYSAVYFLEVSDARYKYPIDWMMFIGLGMLGMTVMGRLQRRPTPSKALA